MIEINLLQKKKKAQLPVVMGVDLNLFNIKMIIFSLVVYYVSDMIAMPVFTSAEEKVQEQISVLRGKLKKIKAEMKDQKNVKAKLQAYNKQFERLKRRSSQVDAIIKQRTNPRKLLERLARDIPSEVWFDRLEITEDRMILIDGGAEEYTSIGRFITQAKDALFFETNKFQLKKSATVEDKMSSKGKRIENFSIEGRIKTFDPWNE